MNYQFETIGHEVPEEDLEVDSEDVPDAEEVHIVHEKVKFLLSIAEEFVPGSRHRSRNVPS